MRVANHFFKLHRVNWNICSTGDSQRYTHSTSNTSMEGADASNRNDSLRFPLVGITLGNRLHRWIAPRLTAAQAGRPVRKSGRPRWIKYVQLTAMVQKQRPELLLYDC